MEGNPPSKINIELFWKNFTSFSKMQQRFYTKLLHQILPLNKRQYKIHFSQKIYPLCKATTENEQHFLHCGHWEYNSSLNKLNEQSKTVALRHNIDPMIQRIFKAKLKQH